MLLNINKVLQDAYDSKIKRAYNQAVEEYEANRIKVAQEENEDFETIPFFQQGTFSKDNPNIYYQSGVVDKIKNLFKPKDKDKRTYISDLRAVERGEDTRIRVGELPQVYKELGLSDGMVRTNKDVILKDSIEKHHVPLNVVEDLPELFADPILVMDSRSVDGRLVAVLDAVDKSGQQVIVAISPNKKQEGGYHFIPSFYGKTKISNFIETNINEGNLKYIKSQQALDTLQLRPQVKTLLGSLNNNILQKSDIVKQKPKVVYQESNNGIELDITGHDDEFKSLQERQETNVGENMQDSKFEDWIEEQIREQEEERINILFFP